MVHFGQRKQPRLFLGILIILIAVLSGIYAVYKKKPDNNTEEKPQVLSLQGPIGERRPDFVLPDMSGHPRAINEWDNQVVLVNFWATWCEPCRHEIPVFTQIQASRRYPGLQFVGVAIDEQGAVEDFIKQLATPINYPMLIGDDDAITIAKQYGNEFGILPYSVIIDRTGRIAFIQYGEFPQDELEMQIKPLL